MKQGKHHWYAVAVEADKYLRAKERLALVAGSGHPFAREQASVQSALGRLRKAVADWDAYDRRMTAQAEGEAGGE